MDVLISVFGVQHHVSLVQECARAVLIFCYGLVLLRLSGRRTFGHWSAPDVILSIVIGSALARALTGNAPLVGTMAAAAVLAVLHVIIGHITARSTALARIVEGRCVTLADHGRIDDVLRKRHMISDSDLAEALREKGLDGVEAMAQVKCMTLEPSGKITVVKRDP